HDPARQRRPQAGHRQTPQDVAPRNPVARRRKHKRVHARIWNRTPPTRQTARHASHANKLTREKPYRGGREVLPGKGVLHHAAIISLLLVIRRLPSPPSARLA